MSQDKIHRARRALDSAMQRYPRAAADFDRFQGLRGAPDFENWPDWCWMPIAAGVATVSGGGPNNVPWDALQHPAILTALMTWRRTQGIYRFDPALMAAVIDTPIDGDVPADALQRLPEWCVYIDLAGSALSPQLHGVWAHMEYDVARGGQAELRFVLDCARDPRQPFASDGLQVIPVLLVGTLDASLARLRESAQEQLRIHKIPDLTPLQPTTIAHRELVRALVALTLYLCSQDRDVADRSGKPASIAHQGRQSSPRASVTQWEVGTRIGAALRAAYQREQTGGDAAPSGRSVRPHVRRAHWHTMLSGARFGADGTPIDPAHRTRNLRWLPPIPVNVDDLDGMPSVIHPVKDPR